jgi:hypothetical protein
MYTIFRRYYSTSIFIYTTFQNKLKVIEAITEESSQLRNMKHCLEYEMQSKDQT